jgi:hypothetical protein
MDTIVEPNTNIVKRGVVIGSIVNLDRGSNRFSTRSLNRSLGLPIANTRVVGTR